MNRAVHLVTVFADVPSPGTAFGVEAHGGRVYATMSAGNPTHVNTQGERIFTYDTSGSLVHTTVVDEGPASNMGLDGLAFDAAGRLYVADMNGMIRRFATQPVLAEVDPYASAPAPYAQLGWYASMWNDIEFDLDRSGYVSRSVPPFHNDVQPGW